MSVHRGALLTRTSVLTSAWVHTATPTYHPEVNFGSAVSATPQIGRSRERPRVDQLQGPALAALGSRLQTQGMQ